MATNETIFKQLLRGKESIRGTQVAATAKLYSDATFAVEKTLAEYPNRSGTRFGRRRPGYNRPVYTASGTELLTYEDAPIWFQSLIKGGTNVDAGDSGTPGKMYKHTYLPSASVDDAESWTVEYGDPQNGYRSTQFMLVSGTIRIEPDSEAGWMLDWEGVMRDRTPIAAAYTPAIPERQTEAIRAAGTKVYIDAAGGTIGGTQQIGKVISGTVTIATERHMKPFLEDDQIWAANRVGMGQWTVDGSLNMEFDSNVELANYLSATEVQRKIRLERVGSQIHATPAVDTKKITLDLYGYWSSFTEGDREGNITATFGLSGYYDTTAATDLKIVVQNALASLP
jgi:hypothetical protein